jgi:hypothetical protein
MNPKQGDSLHVYLLLWMHVDGPVIEGIYTNKVQAEADMRILQAEADYYRYCIVERKTVPHDNNR